MALVCNRFTILLPSIRTELSIAFGAENGYTIIKENGRKRFTCEAVGKRRPPVTRVIGIGNQDFEKIRVNNYFYIDKTAFIQEWWEAADEVTLIARPRRFGKTLNMSAF